MERKKTSVVVPFYNAEKTLRLCLDSLCSQTLKPHEIILVDNSSKDGSKEIVDSFIKNFNELRINYVFCEKRGPSAARNKGSERATGDWLIFTDSDCVPSQNWISDYTAHFDKESLGAVAGCIKPYLPSGTVEKSLALFTLPENRSEIIHDNFNINEGLYPTANLAVKKKVLNSIGGFNEGLRYGEDHELCYRIYRSGYKIKAVKNAMVEHMHRSRLTGLIKQAYGIGSAHPFKLRHLSGGEIIFSLPFSEINRTKPGKYVWIDLVQADKKLFLFFLLGLIWWPFYFLMPTYFLRLCFFVRKKSVEKDIATKIGELPFLAILLILKSLALTCGRISHSFKHRVVCF